MNRLSSSAFFNVFQITLLHSTLSRVLAFKKYSTTMLSTFTPIFYSCLKSVCMAQLSTIFLISPFASIVKMHFVHHRHQFISQAVILLLNWVFGKIRHFLGLQLDHPLLLCTFKIPRESAVLCIKLH